MAIPQEDAGEFEKHWRELLVHVDDFHQAKHVYSTAIEKYGLQKAQPTITQAELSSFADKVVAAETQLEKKREALLEKIKDGQTSNMVYQDVVELLPLLDTRRRGRKYDPRGPEKPILKDFKGHYTKVLRGADYSGPYKGSTIARFYDNPATDVIGDKTVRCVVNSHEPVR